MCLRSESREMDASEIFSEKYLAGPRLLLTTGELASLHSGGKLVADVDGKSAAASGTPLPDARPPA